MANTPKLTEISQPTNLISEYTPSDAENKRSELVYKKINL